SHFALQEQKQEEKSKSMVLLFAGPSGHGKTELARSLGKLTSRDLEMVDCTSMRCKTDLWGPFHPFQGWENGSALSNFLENHASQECIVFLDEFEKTKEEVQESLLKPFDEVKESTVPSQARLVGDINVQVRRSYSVCRALVTDGYIPELGARSIANTVNRDIGLSVVNDYLDKRERLHENQGRCTYVVGVDEDDMIDVSEAPTN
ncbi:P-loop containing nucleoside triphosphate hydrolase protein, partial [Neurospora crassa]